MSSQSTEPSCIGRLPPPRRQGPPPRQPQRRPIRASPTPSPRCPPTTIRWQHGAARAAQKRRPWARRHRRILRAAATAASAPARQPTQATPAGLPTALAESPVGFVRGGTKPADGRLLSTSRSPPPPPSRAARAAAIRRLITPLHAAAATKAVVAARTAARLATCGWGLVVACRRAASAPTF